MKRLTADELEAKAVRLEALKAEVEALCFELRKQVATEFDFSVAYSEKSKRILARFNPIMELTPGERKLLQAMADGWRIKEYALETGTSFGRKRCVLYVIRDKLGTDTTAQAVAMGIRRGIID